MNLPATINLPGKGTISYIYDANGTKLEKKVVELAAAYNGNQEKNTRTSYIGSFVYENDKLQFFGHEEGRVRLKNPVNSASAGICL